jgi:hypothetical protein
VSNSETTFPPRLLLGWIAGAAAVFAVSLYLMGQSEMTGTDSSGASTFSRSAIGHAGIAELLQQVGFSVGKSRSNPLQNLAKGSVVVVAEPRFGRQSEQSIRATLKAERILLVLPKWTGESSAQTAGWLGTARKRFIGEAQWTLSLIAPRAEVIRVDEKLAWTTNALGRTPNLVSPAQLVRGTGLRGLIATERGMLLAEIREGNRTIWILADPDAISNHGLARQGNALVAIAMFKRLRAGNGSVVFDETVHGYLVQPASPFMLLLRFPFVIATVLGLIAIALLLWATLARFGPAQSAPPPLRAGREGLLQNIAKLIEHAGQQQVVVRRYVQETIRDVARQLHAPRGLSGAALTSWLQRVGTSRGAEIDCSTLVEQTSELAQMRRPDPLSLIRLARDIHGWKGQILHGCSRDPRNR